MYAGAGFSLEASRANGGKLPTSHGLAYHLAEKTYKDGKRKSYPVKDEVLVLGVEAQKFEDACGRRELVVELFKIFGEEGLTPGHAHKLAIRRFPIIVTTNYDSLFERAAYLQGKQPMIVRLDIQIALIGAGDWPTIIKLHGDLNDPGQIVITTNDYKDDEKRLSRALAEELASQLRKRTVLFVGSTLDDGDFRDIYIKEVFKLLGVFAPPAFLVAPVSSGDAMERSRWESRQQEWEVKRVTVIDSTAGTFLRRLERELKKP